ncbi:MAG: SpoIIE family protein phosphatase, partial [Candidatus Latescibacteria bacterium]|nr:SpoIIE family protein phosphatase [bacterium]MBD3424110.1 SpoIIE family protein phosphatase [Candidatus Latescibacterota bacterium]
KRLAGVILKAGREEMSAEQIKDRIMDDVTEFMGDSSQSDDITIIVLKVLQNQKSN